MGSWHTLQQKQQQYQDNEDKCKEQEWRAKPMNMVGSSGNVDNNSNNNNQGVQKEVFATLMNVNL